MNVGPRAATAADLAADIVRPEIRALSAYEVPNGEGLIKLDAMENPYGLPDAVRSRVRQALSRVAINRYPDGGAHAVKAALARALGIPSSLAMILGNGSDELIHLIALALAKPGAAMLAPDPSFVMYRLDALFAGQ